MLPVPSETGPLMPDWIVRIVEALPLPKLEKRLIQVQSVVDAPFKDLLAEVDAIR